MLLLPLGKVPGIASKNVTSAVWRPERRYPWRTFHLNFPQGVLHTESLVPMACTWNKQAPCFLQDFFCKCIQASSSLVLPGVPREPPAVCCATECSGIIQRDRFGLHGGQKGRCGSERKLEWLYLLEFLLFKLFRNAGLPRVSTAHLGSSNADGSFQEL